MARMSLASHPLLLGFEELDRRVERATRTATDGYPPFNIEQRGEDVYRISLAVAGFAISDLGVTVEEGHLVVRGRQPEAAPDRQILHRGIGARAFERSFVLAKDVEAIDARLHQGMLHVDLARRKPERSLRRIPITKSE